jgi:hypothetical protein
VALVNTTISVVVVVIATLSMTNPDRKAATRWRVTTALSAEWGGDLLVAPDTAMTLRFFPGLA